MKSKQGLVLLGWTASAIVSLWAVYAVGGARFRAEQLTYGPVAELGPLYSPDGRSIAFEYFHPTNPEIPQIWYMSSHGDFSAAQPLVDNGRFNGGPSWSPDGLWIAFVAHLPRKHGEVRISSQLFKINVATREIVQLTFLPKFSVLGGTSSWSKDDWIAFVWNGAIYRVGSNGGSVELITTAQTDELSAEPSNLSWSPNGRRLVFSADNPRSDGRETTNIWIFDLESKQFHRLTQGHMDWFPAWQDDENLLFARQLSEKEGAIFRLNLRNKELFQLTSGAIDATPVTLPNRKEILFSRASEFKSGNDLQVFRGFHIWRKRVPSSEGLAYLYRSF